MIEVGERLAFSAFGGCSSWGCIGKCDAAAAWDYFYLMSMGWM